MRYRRLGEPGHEIPVASTDHGLVDLRPLTDDIDGPFLSRVSPALVRHELERGRLPFSRRAKSCGWVPPIARPGQGGVHRAQLPRPRRGDRSRRCPTSRWSS